MAERHIPESSKQKISKTQSSSNRIINDTDIQRFLSQNNISTLRELLANKEKCNEEQKDK